MADHDDLKKLYVAIETDDAEMLRFRSRLGAKLREPAPKSSAWKWLWVGSPLLVGLAAWILIVTLPSDIEQSSLQQLQSIVAASSDLGELREQAQSLQSSGDEHASLDADMLLCLAHPDGLALQVAARGAIRDPRPEFRAFYVEYLLDHADSYQLNIEQVETAMDKEIDPLSLELYARLLNMAEPDPTTSPSV